MENDVEVPNLGKLVEVLKTHKGSMQMQSFIKRSSFNNLNMIIEEIKGDFGKLMIDQYGNYFCQKLLHNVSSEQRLTILRHLQKDFVSVSCDEVGTHPMQRLVEMVNLDEERICIFQAIKGDIVNMAFHHKGNYVLLLTLQALRGEQLQYVIE